MELGVFQRVEHSIGDLRDWSFTRIKRVGDSLMGQATD